MIDTTVTSDTAAADEWVRVVRAANDPAGRASSSASTASGSPTTARGRPPRSPFCSSASAPSAWSSRCSTPTSCRRLSGASRRPCGAVRRRGRSEAVRRLRPRVRRPVDLEGHCNEYLGIGGLGRRRLGAGYAREVLGMTMEKPWHVTMSNWERRQLEVAQVQYACIDAYVSYKLGERLLDN
ncbi:hypothetical protein ZWY2020_028402 [Hordeum vulgare]|nr:hypothetical protein ZWY2020_028402 [Hordeum vulgare]